MNETLISISIDELCQLEGIERQVIIEIVEYGIVEPIMGAQEQQWRFDPTNIHWIKKALRLSQDFEIDWFSVSMVIDLMRQKQSLQKENEAFQRLLKRFMANDSIIPKIGHL